MILSSYNLENLFLRARILNVADSPLVTKILKAHAEINAIIAQKIYTAADKTKLLSLLSTLGLKNSDESKYAILRQNRGKLVKRSAGGAQIVASGREEWIGWVDLTVEEVNEVATRNTGQVIRDVKADIIGVIEVENRPTMVRFSNRILPAVGGASYAHHLLIDGNDERGIDVGIMVRNGFEIESMRSHVDDTDAEGIIFSRDCPEYRIRTPLNNLVVVLVNHFKSKGFGTPQESNRKRERQATRVAQIYQQLRQTFQMIAVIGDLNDTPTSLPLLPLVQATDLKDISMLQNFDDQGRPGTYANGTATNKIDYILLSPALFATATGGGIFRKGVWGGANGTLFPHYPEMKKASDAASDHAAVFAALAI